MRELMNRMPNLAAEGDRNRADPWVVTLAQVRGTMVVTDEKWSNTRPTKPPKIPNVCNELGIKWKTPAEFIEMIDC